MSPVITGFSAPLLQHDQPITINGSGFGTKNPVTPFVWDDCMHGQPTSARWDYALPTGSYSLPIYTGPRHPEWDMDYRTQTDGTPMPHPFVTKYLCGHYGQEQYDVEAALGALQGFDYNIGPNIELVKILNPSSTPIVLPFNFYVNWKRRANPLWTFDSGNPPDGNFKTLAYFAEGGAIEAQHYYYMSYNAGPHNATQQTISSVISNPFAETIYTRDEAIAAGITTGFIDYGTTDCNLEWSKWTQAEMVQRSSPTNGYCEYLIDGQIFWPRTGLPNGHYEGYPTDRFPAGINIRSFLIGGFNRDHGLHNWRYYADLYLDKSWARICIGNASTYNACTVREMQIPTSWSDTVLQATIKQNTLSSLNGSYLYVVDANGAVSNGFLLSGAPPVNNSLTGLQEARGMAISGLQGAHEALASGVVLPAGALIPKRFQSHRRR